MYYLLFKMRRVLHIFEKYFIVSLKTFKEVILLFQIMITEMQKMSLEIRDNKHKGHCKTTYLNGIGDIKLVSKNASVTNIRKIFNLL